MRDNFQSSTAGRYCQRCHACSKDGRLRFTLVAAYGWKQGETNRKEDSAHATMKGTKNELQSSAESIRDVRSLGELELGKKNKVKSCTLDMEDASPRSEYAYGLWELVSSEGLPFTSRFRRTGNSRKQSDWHEFRSMSPTIRWGELQICWNCRRHSLPVQLAMWGSRT